MSFAGAMLIALTIDAVVGWPDRLYRSIGHPVTWLGAMIQTLDSRMNRDFPSVLLRRLSGVLAALAVIGTAAGLGWLLQSMLPDGAAGVVLAGALAWPLVAMRSLYGHVRSVAVPLRGGGIDSARSEVSKIVGRDPARLDEAGIARAAIESLAENASDGIVAPIVWGTVLGLPGIAAYKAINTLDSMIGHRTPRHESFGWASARIDDIANLVPARLTGLFIALISARPGAAMSCMLDDARKHRSPNAGWPEAAMAGALGVRLSGPRVYGDRVSEEPWLNADARDPTAIDISRGLGLYVRAMIALAALLAAIAATSLLQ